MTIYHIPGIVHIGVWVRTGADTGFPERGGEDIPQAPLPLGHCLRDVIRPPEN